jgi:hypothetical protein
MDKKSPGEGKTYKTLQDGRVLLRSSYADYATVALSAEDFDRVKKLSVSEVMSSVAVIVPALPVSILTWHGRIELATAAKVLLPMILL